MTPERAAELARNACGVVDTSYSVPLAIPHAVFCAIRQAVNEFADEAKKVAEDNNPHDSSGHEMAASRIASAIDALKLPEE